MEEREGKGGEKKEKAKPNRGLDAITSEAVDFYLFLLCREKEKGKGRSCGMTAFDTFRRPRIFSLTCCGKKKKGRGKPAALTCCRLLFSSGRKKEKKEEKVRREGSTASYRLYYGSS